MFSEKISNTVGICVFQNTVFVTQYSSHCVNMYELEGKLMKSVGSYGNGEAQFKFSHGIDKTEVSFHARNRLVYTST